MYFKSLKMVNFRKFRTTENIIEFADAESYEKQKCDNQVDVNVASTVTLVVGKNNAGKTTIIQALDKLVNHNDKFGVKDFNMDYLKEMAMKYQEDNFEEIPSIDFEITIGLDKGKDDYVTNIVPFLTIGGVTATEVTISVKFELTEKETFINAVKAAFSKEKKKFNALYELSNVIEDKISLFKINYYNAKGKMVERFRLNQLIEFVPILVTNIESGNALSQAFNRIVKYRYENTFSSDKQQIENELDTINDKLTQNIDASHTKDINTSLDKIISGNSIQVNLCADITFKKLMENLIRYEYVEGDKYIPENQFGLGYSNLMMIIAQLIDYIEKYPESSFNSKVNLISIEEPETHMHPQMQQVFLKYLMDHYQTNTLQGLITTHSNEMVRVAGLSHLRVIRHIKNFKSKLYDLSTLLKELKDDDKKSSDKKESNKLENFYDWFFEIGYSELIFADKAIFYEGDTERLFIRKAMSLKEYQKLKQQYIAFVQVGGAYAKNYEKLIKFLEIKSLIITDIDYDKDKIEISDVNNSSITNATIKHFYAIDYPSKNPVVNDFYKWKKTGENIVDDLIYISYQTEQDGYARTLEEAMLNKFYKMKVDETCNKNEWKLKRKESKLKFSIPNRNADEEISVRDIVASTSENKTDFMYSVIMNQYVEKMMPNYIDGGLKWLME